MADGEHVGEPAEDELPEWKVTVWFEPYTVVVEAEDADAAIDTAIDALRDEAADLIATGDFEAVLADQSKDGGT